MIEYQWNLNDYHFTSGDESSILTYYGLNDVGTYDVDLEMTMNRRVKDCSFRVQVYDAPYFGIDLGTTYSCIGYQSPLMDPNTNRRTTTIVHADQNMQEYCIPTMIYFPPDGGKILVGYEAKKMLETDPKNVIYDVKRIVGRRSTDPEVERFRTEHDFQLTDEAYPRIVIPNHGITIRPEQVLC